MRKRRASSVISSFQATPMSGRQRDDDERHGEDDSEDEGYESEVGRQAKRKKCMFLIYSMTRTLPTLAN